MPETLNPNFTRDEYGLLTNVNYIRNEDGSINWRKMVKPEHLVPNREAFERRSQPVPSTVDGLEDKDLLILLQGLKDLAKLRGYRAVKHRIAECGPTFCCVETTIDWEPNFETGFETVSFTALADASSQNTNGFAAQFPAAIAENRGFVRCVRNFLGINITGKDELGSKSSVDEESSSPPTGQPLNFLKGLLSDEGVTFEQFQNRMIQLKIDGAADWKGFDSIPATQALELIEMVVKVLEEKKRKKAAAAKA